MDGFALYILTALALVLVIEGLLYALFPQTVQRLFAAALALPPARLRLFGTVMAAIGFAVILALGGFSSS